MEHQHIPPCNLFPFQATSSHSQPDVFPFRPFVLMVDIADAPIGPRSTLYTEPAFLDACQYEFKADTESFISIAEKLIIPYEWSTYDVLVLPKSFPYGGMENPNLTTVTPTLIAGDRSNVDVVAHEASHSWSGNLVTNATWEDFWLNEGIYALRCAHVEL
jgi:leukotriene-A4 hydrolase